MINVKQAVNSAITNFQDLYNGGYSNLALEEVELTDDEEYWLVTLGYNPPSTGLQVMTNTARREYKVLKIDAETGDFVKMKIRNSND